MNNEEFWALQAELDRRQAEIAKKEARWFWFWTAVIYIGLPILAASNIQF